MGRANKCDRCGKYYEGFYQSYEICHNSNLFQKIVGRCELCSAPLYRTDLCKSCEQDLARFMNGAELKEYNDE